MTIRALFSPVRLGLVGLIAATLWFVVGNYAKRVESIHAYTALGATDDSGARVQPAGDTHALILPLASMDANWWVLYTEQLAAEGHLVRHTTRDNPPEGREVHWSSALTLLLADLAWLLRCFAPFEAGESVELAALWIGPACLAFVLSLVSWLAYRRFGATVAAVLFALLGTSGAFLDCFAPGEADHHGLAATLGLLSVWFLIAAGGGRATDDTSQNPARSALTPPGHAQARRGFAAAGMAGGAGLWISAATAIPVLICIAVGAIIGARLSRGSLPTRDRIHPELWAAWGRWGAATSLLFYLLEYFPAHLGLRLEVNHPLHALAWWGGAAWVARLVDRIANKPPLLAGPRRWRIIGETIALLAPALLLAIGGARYFSPGDALLQALHRDYIHEFRGLLPSLAEAGWWLAPLSWLIVLPALGLLHRSRENHPHLVAPLVLLLACCGGAMTLTVLQIRWQGLAAALSAGLAVWLVAAESSLAATRPARARRAVLGACIAGSLLHYPTLCLLEARASSVPPPPAPAELASSVVRDVAWALHSATEGTHPVILSGPTTSTQLAYFGGFRVLGTLYWENAAGLHAAADIFGASDLEESLALCRRHNVTHLVIFSWDDFAPAYARLHAIARHDAASAKADNLANLLASGRLPRWLRPLAYTIPSALGLSDQSVQIYEIHPEQSPAEACLHLVRYLREIGRDADARRILGRGMELLATTPEDKMRHEKLASDFAEEARALGQNSPRPR